MCCSEAKFNVICKVLSNFSDFFSIMFLEHLLCAASTNKAQFTSSWACISYLGQLSISLYNVHNTLITYVKAL